MRKFSVFLCTLLIVAGVGSANASVFTSVLDPLSVVPPAIGSTASGFATLILNDTQDALDFFIQLDGVDLGAQTADPGDDVQGFHIHFGAPGVNGPHALNILAPPSNDVPNLTVDPVAGTLTGTWDDNVLNPSPPPGQPGSIPGASKLLSDSLPALFAGELYFQLHTVEFPASAGLGELRGQIVPEPSTLLLFGFGLIGFAALRRRFKKS